MEVANLNFEKTTGPRHCKICLKKIKAGSWCAWEEKEKRPIPRCRGCGNDALACVGNRAHTRRIYKANLEAVKRWRDKKSYHIECAFKRMHEITMKAFMLIGLEK